MLTVMKTKFENTIERSDDLQLSSQKLFMKGNEISWPCVGGYVDYLKNNNYIIAANNGDMLGEVVISVTWMSSG